MGACVIANEEAVVFLENFDVPLLSMCVAPALYLLLRRPALRRRRPSPSPPESHH